MEKRSISLNKFSICNPPKVLNIKGETFTALAHRYDGYGADVFVYLDNGLLRVMVYQNNYKDALPIKFDLSAIEYIFDDKDKEKEKVINEIKRNPSILFNIHHEENVCMCTYQSCGSCFYEDVTFIEHVFNLKTICEEDLVNISKTIKLDWYKITSIKSLPRFSNNTLYENKNEVNWKQISSDVKYKKTYEFVRLFEEYICWDDVSEYHMNIKDPEIIVFKKKFIPYRNAILSKILKIDDINNHQDELFPYLEDIVTAYRVNILESITWDTLKVYDSLYNFVEKYIDLCISHKHIPNKFSYMIKYATPCQMSILLSIKPDIISCKHIEYYLKNGEVNSKIWNLISLNESLTDEFILKYSDKLDWTALMTWKQFDNKTWLDNIDIVPISVTCRYQRLTPEFIDLNASQIDWHIACEFQELPEWLMRKHYDKLDWGQVSWYQKLSKEFINEFKDRLNMVKLSKNKNVRV